LKFSNQEGWAVVGGFGDDFNQEQVRCVKVAGDSSRPLDRIKVGDVIVAVDNWDLDNLITRTEANVTLLTHRLPSSATSSKTAFRKTINRIQQYYTKKTLSAKAESNKLSWNHEAEANDTETLHRTPALSRFNNNSITISFFRKTIGTCSFAGQTNTATASSIASVATV
jgi:hypothetical protein